jgi:large subunit ribosomal protein L24
MQRVKKGDKVVVIAGKKANKGKTGEVLAVFKDADKVLVQGVNEMTKHIKPDQQNPQGGRVKKEIPIHISNVMLADPKDGKPTRVRIKTLESGQKVRVAVRSGEQLDS